MIDKNMADVAEKAVDKLSAVVDSVSRLAPDVWAAAVRSERIEGVTNTLLLVASYVAGTIITRKFYAWAKAARDPTEPEVVLPAMGLAVIWAVVVGLTLSNLGTELSRAFSPEYHAAAYFLRAVQ